MNIQKETTFPNPFEEMVYISEKSVSPEEIFSRYSIIPFESLMNVMTERINYFIVGRTGVGKSMILTLFDNRFQKTIFKSPLDQSGGNDDYLEMRKNFPQNSIAIYTSLRVESDIDDFVGRGIKNSVWRQYFGDYFGHRFLQKLISLIEELAGNDEWCKHCGVKTDIENNQFDKIAMEFGKLLGKSVERANNVTNWKTLKDYTINRIDEWRKKIKNSNPEFQAFDTIVDLIEPCKFFMQVLKNQGLITDRCILFIIIDQYETLWDKRENNEFRPVFNQAMEQVSRGGIPIEFKIGVRPYAWVDNLQISDNPDDKIQLDRNYTKINLDSLANKYFNDFIFDLSEKCLKRYPDHFQDLTINAIFKSITPIEEIEYYCGRSELKNQHFTRFFYKSPIRKNIINLLQEKTNLFKNSYCRIWFDTLLALGIESRFQTEKIVSISQLKDFINEFFKLLMDEMKSVCICDNHDCLCYQFPKYDGIEQKTYRKRYEFQNKALFIIATSYKFRSKLYAGFEEIVRISSNTALTFVLIVLEAFNRGNTYRAKMKEFLPIIPEVQSDAIKKIAEDFFSNIPYDSGHGLIIHKFLKNLGWYFRDKQINPRDSQKFPNRFSLSTKLELQFKSEKKVPSNPEISYADLLQETLSYRYLAEKPHSDRRLPGMVRYKYTLNLLLCPKFNLTTLDHGPPQYIKQEKSFLIEAFKEDCQNLKKFEKDSKKSKNLKLQFDPAQRTLF